MRKSTKILIIILIILIISLIGYTTYISIQDKQTSTNQMANEEHQQNELENESNTLDIANTTTETTNTIQNNNVEQHQTQSNNTQPELPTGTDVVGQEEQESSNQSGKTNPEEKAIKLAKERWGETSSNYIFAIDKTEGNIYHVAVISNAMTIAYMDVNIETEEVTEN